jgi:hypothetical protein
MDRCPAPKINDPNSVCDRPGGGTSGHCKEHSQVSINIYIKYKKLEEKYDDKPEPTTYGDMFRKYNDYVKILGWRVEHRQQLFHPTKQDVGHSTKINIVRNYIDDLEKRMEEIINRPVPTEAVQQREEEPVRCNVKRFEKIRKRKREHYKNDESWVKLARDYIKQNEESLRQMNKMVDDLEDAFGGRNNLKKKGIHVSCVCSIIDTCISLELTTRSSLCIQPIVLKDYTNNLDSTVRNHLQNYAGISLCHKYMKGHPELIKEIIETIDNIGINIVWYHERKLIRVYPGACRIEDCTMRYLNNQ